MKIQIDYNAKTVDIFGDCGYTESDPYWISFDRFDTLIKLVDWIRHLSSKLWWDRKLTNKLIKAYEEINKTNIPYDA